MLGEGGIKDRYADKYPNFQAVKPLKKALKRRDRNTLRTSTKTMLCKAHGPPKALSGIHVTAGKEHTQLVPGAAAHLRNPLT